MAVVLDARLGARVCGRERGATALDDEGALITLNRIST